MSRSRHLTAFRPARVAAVVIGVCLAQTALADWQPDFTGNGLSSSANALTIYEHDLVVGGWFAMASGNLVHGIARWDGSSWTSLDGGMQGSTPRVVALAVHNRMLIAAGAFTHAGSVAASNIARWDGQSWAPLGNGLDGIVTALTVFEGDLIAGGAFTTAGDVPARNIARWNGTSWSALGAGRAEQVLSLAVWNHALYAGAFYDWSDPHPEDSIGTWNGVSWSSVGSGLPYPVTALCVYAAPWWDRERLIAGGFHDHLSLWNDVDWVDYGDPLAGTTFGTIELVLALTRDENDLYVTGHFLDAGDAAANHIARWDGTAYHPLGDGLYLGTGPNDDAFGSALLVSGGNLYVGGTFSTTGDIRSACIGRWDPSSPSSRGVLATREPRLALRAFPTPANPQVSLSYRLEQPARVQLRIFDLRGQQIATVRDGMMAAGEHTERWHGRGGSGETVPSGVYLAVLEAGGQRDVTRILLAR